MKYRRTESFKKAYDKLPAELQEKAKTAFSLFKQNQRHPSLGIKKMKGREEIWEGRLTEGYRFTFHYERDATGELWCVFRNIGPHNILDTNP